MIGLLILILGLTNSQVYKNLEEPIQYQVEGTPDDIEENDRSFLMKEWEELMSDFIPDDMITFDLQVGQVEILEEYVGSETSLRGAFFVSMFGYDKIDFSMKDPHGQIIVAKGQKREAVFSVNVTRIGQYQFIFSNPQGSQPQTVTFALDIHNATYEHLTHSDLDPISTKIQTLQDGIMDVFYETKFSQMRQEGGYQALQKTHNKLLMFSILETLVILGVSIWQLYYIKKILDNRRMI